MEPGWIYVLVNSSIPGMAKVGRTSRHPAERVAELSGVTGVATPFILAFDQHVEDCWSAERAVHDELERRGLRVALNREFFRGSTADIIRVVLETADASGHARPMIPDRSAGALLLAGDRCLLGLGETLQDSGEAVRLYKLAASRGSLPAYERLGQVYGELYFKHRDRGSRRRALAPLKEGVRCGNAYCYAGMAVLFAGERHISNFVKAWNLFFAHCKDIEDDPAGTERHRLAFTCCRYIATCLELGLRPEHRRDLAQVSDTINATLLNELDRAGNAAERYRIARVLRWTFQSVPRGPAPRASRPGTDARRAVWVSQPENAPA